MEGETIWVFLLEKYHKPEGKLMGETQWEQCVRIGKGGVQFFFFEQESQCDKFLQIKFPPFWVAPAVKMSVLEFFCLFVWFLLLFLSLRI